MYNKTELLTLLIGLMYLITGLSLIMFLILGTKIFIIDPVECLILILISIIFMRGFYFFSKNNKSTGEAYVFVGFIIGFLLGIMALLNLLVNAIFGGLLQETSVNSLINRIFYYTTPTLILGIICFFSHKLMKVHNKAQELARID